MAIDQPNRRLVRRHHLYPRPAWLSVPGSDHGRRAIVATSTYARHQGRWPSAALPRRTSMLFGADGDIRYGPGSQLRPAISLPPACSRTRISMDPESARPLVFMDQQLLASSSRHHVRGLYKSRWQAVYSTSSWIKQTASDQAEFYGTSENAVKTQIWLAVQRPSGPIRPSIGQEAASRPTGRLALHFGYDGSRLGDPLRENAHRHQATCGRRKQMQRFANNQPIEFIRFLTGQLVYSNNGIHKACRM